MGRKRYFEEFTIGEEIITRSRQVDMADIKMFTACTSLCSRVQTDYPYCEKIPGLGQPAVSASHLLNLIDAFLALSVSPEGVPTFHYGYDSVEFRKDVHPGDTVYSIFRLVDKKEKNEKFGVLTFEVSTYNQDGEIVVFDIDKLYCGRCPKED